MSTTDWGEQAGKLAESFLTLFRMGPPEDGLVVAGVHVSILRANEQTGIVHMGAAAVRECGRSELARRVQKALEEHAPIDARDRN